MVRTHAAGLGSVSPQQARVLDAIVACRTAALGGHLSACDTCGHEVISYNSCRNRHCPKCQALNQARWVERRQADLLPVEYHHVVFTIPTELHDLFLRNQAVAYGLLFSSAAQSLLTLARDPRLLGAEVGAMAVLHTWTQTLAYHPHVHCIVPGGGPSPDGTRWVSSRTGYLLPVRALSTLFRGKLLASVERALAEGRMTPGPEGSPQRDLKRAARKKWCVYSKPSFISAEHVVAYLGRYTHRIAISNGRLVSLEDGQVTFRYTDRANGNQPRTMILPATQFLRRFLLHVLPLGFVRIRYFGGLANGTRRRWLALGRRLLGDSGKPPPAARDAPKDRETWQDLLLRLTGVDVRRCPRCQTGRMNVVERFDPPRLGHDPPSRASPT
jgi:hypothetical protein